MPLQNRVDPFGELVAVAARGTLMGNRGGKFHRDDQTLGRRRWASMHWISCELEFRGNHHEPMGRYYTSVFFLDEVTALAAGHRPCFYCRRAEAKTFLGLADPPLTAAAADRIVHAQRRTRQPARPLDVMPDGSMVAIGDAAYAVRGDHLLRWSFDGYTESVPRTSIREARPLTPPLYVKILAAGFQPRWHPTAPCR
jgi:hypothetical protein